MREILFRGKIIELCEYQGQWLEGFYAVENGKPFIAIPKENGLNGFYCDPETVGQYTGLKDRNGTRIFEGDIVKVYDVYCNETVVGVVEFCDGSFRIYDKDFTSYGRWMYCKVEVIGNIHDNPELIKALNYDREQYEKGYKDGKADAQKSGQWMICSDGYYPYCSICKNEPKNRIMTDYCPNCGAYMKGEINDKTTSDWYS